MHRDAARDPAPILPSPPGTDIALLLPGMTLNATVFPDLGIPTLGVDFSRLRVGPDGVSPDLARRRMAYYADLLTERLEGDAQWSAARRRIVIGHSFGGMLALAWLLADTGEPARQVHGLLLVSTTAGPMFGAARVRVGRVGRYELRVPAKFLMRFWNLRSVTRGVAALVGSGGPPVHVDLQRLGRHSDLAVGLAGWRNSDWRARRAFRCAMQGFDLRSRLGALNVPTIVLHGTRDTFFSTDVARAMVERLPRAELRIVPGAAHVLPLTHPGEVLRAVRDLRRTGTDADGPADHGSG